MRKSQPFAMIPPRQETARSKSHRLAVFHPRQCLPRSGPRAFRLSSNSLSLFNFPQRESGAHFDSYSRHSKAHRARPPHLEAPFKLWPNPLPLEQRHELAGGAGPTGVPWSIWEQPIWGVIPSIGRVLPHTAGGLPWAILLTEFRIRPSFK